MKKITHLFSVLSLIFVSLLLTSCDPDGILTDKQTGEDIPLVMIDPNFTTTSFQLRLLDIETGNRIEEPVEVELFSNKPLVDLSGKYISSETITNGLLNFSLSPNEEVSQSDTLYLFINAISENSGYVFTSKFDQFSEEKYSIITLEGTKSSNISAEMNSQKILSVPQDNRSDALNILRSIVGKTLYIDGNTYWDFILNNYRPDIGFSPFTDGYRINPTGSKLIEDYRPLHSFEAPIPLEKNAEFKVVYENALLRNQFTYVMNFEFMDQFGYASIRINRDGTYVFRNLRGGGQIINDRFPNFDGRVVMNEGLAIRNLWIEHFLNQPNLRMCDDGFNFRFLGLDDQKTPVEFEYAVRRDNNYLSTIGYTSLTDQYPVHNTGNHYYSSELNSVEFIENSQFFIEPRVLELEGAESCGSTYTFNVLPKDEVEKYTINVQTQCTGQNGSVLPTANVFFREQGKTNWEGTRFAGGKSTLYLKPETLYDIDGQYRDSNFNFTLSTGRQLQEAIKQSIENNPELHNMLISNTTKDGNKHLDIKIVFTSESCPT